MSGILTLETFQPLIGSVFTVALAEGGLGLVLSEVQSLGHKTVAREPFSLLFHGPLAPVLPQQTYALEHLALGQQEIFLVPLGPDAIGMRYEAVFT